MLTPRATTSPIVSNEMLACAIISAFAGRERTIVSVGLNAVAVLKAKSGFRTEINQRATAL